MIRLGLRLTLCTGREALIRLLVTAAAVGLGVGLLLSVLATYHAYRDVNYRACWECTHEPAAKGQASLLWNYHEDFYQGQPIERVDVATLTPNAPSMPGLSRMPGPGQIYTSPALVRLLRTVPADQLGDRFPGTLTGTVGTAALSGPDELVVVIGRTPAELATLPDAVPINHINTAPRQLSTSSFYQFGFAVGTVALLVPMLVLIGTATRLAAARREERFAALRLVGATRNQVAVIATVEAMVGAVCGAVVGIGLFAALRPALAALPILGSRFFTDEITPTGWGFGAALVVVPVAAAAACLVSLRRVGISPLGVSRRVTPPAPRWWRVIPLIIGLALFCIPLLARRDPHGPAPSPGPAVIGLATVMLGVMIAGPCLTMQAARALAGVARSASTVLAARRLADNPRAAFRSVSGLVLAILIGTALAGIVPAAIAAQNTSQDGSLTNVLRIDLSGEQLCKAGCTSPTGLAPSQAADLLERIAAIPGTSTLAAYDVPGVTGRFGGPSSAVSCADLRQWPVLGHCSAGTTAVSFNPGVLDTDNIAALNKNLPLVNNASPAITLDTHTAKLNMALVKVINAATLERVRTMLADTGMAVQAQTFGEVAAVRSELYLEIQRLVTIIATVTLLIAGVSLTVSVGGSLIERKRPFTLLRLSGTGIATLYRVVLQETVVPLVAATLLAVAIGFALALPVARTLAPQRHAWVVPEPSFYLTTGIALVSALGVILACLPLLARITDTEQVRFE